MNKIETTIIAVFTLIIGLVSGYYVGYDNGWDAKPVPQTPAPISSTPTTPTVPTTPGATPTANASTDAFQNSNNYGFYGTLTLTGYLSIQKHVCNPGDMCGNTVDYASFVFTDSTSPAINDFISQGTGNSFMGEKKVGLGCYEKTPEQRIYFENFADSGKINGAITGDDFAKLFASTKDHPVQLKLTRPIYTSGQGAPDCYSHFRDFDVL